MIVDKLHEIISVKQSRWLAKYVICNTQKRNRTVNKFEKDSCNLLNSAFYWKRMENVRKRIKYNLLGKIILRKFLNNNQI